MRDKWRGRLTDGVLAMMWTSVVVWRELIQKAKLSIHRVIYVPNLTYGHELRVEKNEIVNTRG